MGYIDLHTHTNYSDGSATVIQTLELAERLGLSHLAISDHNTVDAYGEVMRERSRFSGKILPAVELTTTYNAETIEVLGYGIDLNRMGEWISSHYLSFREKQIKGARLDATSMLGHGVALDPDFVDAMLNRPETVFNPNSEVNRPYLLAEIKRHPENVRFFDSTEEFENIGVGAFTRKYIYNPQSTLFSDQAELYQPLTDVIATIHACGGLAFLAHPFVYTEMVINQLDDILSFGVDGIECHYGTFSAEQKQFLVDFCNKRGVFRSGGSDHHGTDIRPKNILGLSDGEKISYSLVSDWICRLSEALI